MLSHMKYERQQAPRPWLPAVARLGLAITLTFAAVPVRAQDIRGMQICTAEKQMERRTSCLQANVEFLQQALLKLGRETQARIDGDGKALAAARDEIAALRSEVKKLEGELAKLQAKANPPGKK